MGTRSRIGLVLDTDHIVSVYCHYDGYIQHNGRKLVELFNTQDLVEDLINGGDMSCLDTIMTWESRPLKQTIIREDGSQCVDYPRDSDGNWIYSPVKSESSLSIILRGVKMHPPNSHHSMSLSQEIMEKNGVIFTPLIKDGNVGNLGGVKLTLKSII